jgi:hypothetical protein
MCPFVTKIGIPLAKCLQTILGRFVNSLKASCKLGFRSPVALQKISFCLFTKVHMFLSSGLISALTDVPTKSKVALLSATFQVLTMIWYILDWADLI